jgi:hypothetical protein
VYVDRDPIVLAHAHQLLRGAPEGATSYIYGELREPGAILHAAAKTLDFSRPVAVMLFGILHFFSDADDPRAVVGQLVTPLAPDSCLALSHLARDVEGEALAETFRRLNAVMAESVTLRSHDEVAEYGYRDRLADTAGPVHNRDVVKSCAVQINVRHIIAKTGKRRKG